MTCLQAIAASLAFRVRAFGAAGTGAVPAAVSAAAACHCSALVPSPLLALAVASAPSLDSVPCLGLAAAAAADCTGVAAPGM